MAEVWPVSCPRQCNRVYVVLLCFALVGISSPVLAVDYSQTIAILKTASLDYFLSVLCNFFELSIACSYFFGGNV